MAMCGDDDAARNEGESAKGTEGTRSAYKGISAKAGVAEARSDRLSVEDACTADSKPTCPCSKP